MQNKIGLTILIAEDDPDDRFLIKEAFEEAKLANPIEFVEDGVELLDYLLKQGSYAKPPKRAQPGLILLDLNMPRMDGREALAEIKSNPALRHIPLVILTTSKSEEDLLHTYNLGANSFIAKPVTFEGLVDVIKALKNYWLQVVEMPPS